MFEKSSREECPDKIGKPPIATRWIDANRGTDEVVLARFRLVARGFKTKGESEGFDLFAAAPPLEAKRTLLQMAVRKNEEQSGTKCKLLFMDVKKARLNGKLKEDERVYVQLLLEAGSGVARLRQWLHGMRPAAKAWGEDYAGVGGGVCREPPKGGTPSRSGRSDRLPRHSDGREHRRPRRRFHGSRSEC